MPTLDEWQSRLHLHFETLRKNRPESRPIFALEHGLNDQEVSDLRIGIVQEISRGRPKRDHVLPWIVHASEVGYKFSGEEYWQTFADETSLAWHVFGDRYLIRSFFQRFHREYGGVRPTGPWAENFTIICWPIANAVLPIDLQKQLAKILFDLRHQFRPEFFDSPELLGKKIEQYSYYSSSRFRQLAEEHVLIGQIAAALLTQADADSTPLILTSTLQRIANDLEQQRYAGAWMRGAAQSAQEVRKKGIRATEETKTRAEHTQINRLDLNAKFHLRQVGDAEWDVLVTLPDLRPMLEFDRLRPVLMGSRVSITGSYADTPRPRGWLLRGSQTVRMKRWPNPDEPVMSFEESTPEIEYLLGEKFASIFGHGPWVFRLHEDGVGNPVESRLVRPGQSYIALARSRFEGWTGLGQEVTLTCEQIEARRFDLPDFIDGELEEGLRAIRLRPVTGVEVWPVGLPASLWDGEGSAEYTTNCMPRFAVRNLGVGPVVISLTGDGIEDSLTTTQNTALIELPTLAEGAYQVEIALGDGEKPLGVLDLKIRAPHVSSDSSLTGTALVVIVDPPRPSLEELLGGEFSVEIGASPGRQAECQLLFFDHGDQEPSLSVAIGSVELPCTRTRWSEFWNSRVRQEETTWSQFDQASRVELVIQAPGLGRFVLDAEREFTSLRWRVQKDRQGYALRLIDDTGRPETPAVASYDFSHPDTPSVLESTLVEGVFRVPGEGGLFVAETTGRRAAVLIPPDTDHYRSARPPSVRARQRSITAVQEYLDLASVWYSATSPANPLAVAIHFRVLSTLHAELFRILGGDNWHAAERDFIDSPTPQGQARLIECLAPPRYRLLKSAVDGHWFDLCDASVSQRVTRLNLWAINYLGLRSTRRLTRGGDVESRWLAEFALRLASAPHSVPHWSVGLLVPAIQWLMEAPILARVARFLVLAIHASTDPLPLSEAKLYGGEWDWS